MTYKINDREIFMTGISTTRTIYNLPGLKLWIFGPGVEIFSCGDYLK